MHLNPDSQDIVKRFFEVFEEVKEAGILRRKIHFTNRYGINRRSFYISEKNPESGRFEPAWIKYLVEDYGASAEYIITGRGAKITKKRKLSSTQKANQP